MVLIDQTLITGRHAAWGAVLEDAAQKGRILAGCGALHGRGRPSVLNRLGQTGCSLQALTL
ncbi:MAG: hypothetical protein WCO04_10260 [Pseudomonadota bacterium]